MGDSPGGSRTDIAGLADLFGRAYGRIDQPAEHWWSIWWHWEPREALHLPEPLFSEAHDLGLVLEGACPVCRTALGPADPEYSRLNPARLLPAAPAAAADVLLAACASCGDGWAGSHVDGVLTIYRLIRREAGSALEVRRRRRQ